jgi:uncharacterized Tic20 family protein
MDKEFKYPLLGGRLTAYLGFGPESEPPFDESKEDQWVAGLCHATAILQLWGLIVPLAVWLTQKDRSTRLRFQAMQAFSYQLLAFIGYLGFMALYFVGFIGFFALMIFLPSLSRGVESPANSLVGIVFVVFMIVILLVWLVVAIAMPAYYLFAAIAGISVLRGKDYRYPILGKFLARRMNIESKAG